jgi:hypothetical protein
VLVDINTCISEAVKTREAPKGSILLGSELMDLVIKPGAGSDLAEVKMPSPAEAWLNLVELVDAILVCSKLGQALKPVPEVPLPATPCDCIDLPTQSFYLAAHLWCLETLLERRNRHVSLLQTTVVEIKKDCVWSLNGQPFRRCLHPLNNTYWADPRKLGTSCRKSRNKGFFILGYQLLRVCGRCQSKEQWFSGFPHKMSYRRRSDDKASILVPLSSRQCQGKVELACGAVGYHEPDFHSH